MRGMGRPGCVSPARLREPPSENEMSPTRHPYPRQTFPLGGTQSQEVGAGTHRKTCQGSGLCAGSPEHTHRDTQTHTHRHTHRPPHTHIDTPPHTHTQTHRDTHTDPHTHTHTQTHRDTRTHTCPLAPEELCIPCRDEGCRLVGEVTAAPQSELQTPAPFPWRWPGPSPRVTFPPVLQDWGIRPFNRRGD